MTEVLELTQAEKEMIALKPEQEALVAREKELKRQAQLEKDIASKRQHIRTEQAEAAAQIKATHEFASKLPGFKVEIQTIPRNVKVTEYVDGNYITLWSEDYTIDNARLSDGSGYGIKVCMHETWSGRWSSRKVCHGYKMYISGPGIDWKTENRAYKNPKTVLATITAAKDQIAYEKAAKAKQANALTTVSEETKAKYPDATVTIGYDYESSYGRAGRSIKYDTMTVLFANGISIVYRVYSDGSLARKSINFPKLTDGAKGLMDILGGLDLSDKIVTQ